MPNGSPAGSEHRLAGAGGVSLHGEFHGGGPPVLLLHGGGQTAGAWSTTAQRLADGGYTSVAVDLRGHGMSDWAPDGDYALDSFAADVVALVGALEQPVHLVGASLGGLSALMAAGRLPASAVASLVLVDVTLRVNLEGARRILDFMLARPDGFASLDEAADSVAAYQPTRTRTASTEGLKRNLRQGADGRWRWHWDPAFVHGAKALDVLGAVEELTGIASRLALPVLLVRGGNSDVVDDPGVEHLLTHAPRVQVVEVPKAGHMVAGDDNDRFSAAVLNFLDAQPRRI
jgi:pimeloyl-ACP methyl ester carboxylesterase